MLNLTKSEEYSIIKKRSHHKRLTGSLVFGQRTDFGLWLKLTFTVLQLTL